MELNLKQLEQLFSILADGATVGGIVLAAIVFFVERRRYIKERELATFSATCTDYLEYLRLCMEHPEVEVVEASSSEDTATAAERNQRLMLHIVINMLERAYYLYRNHDSDFKSKQWDGWKQYTEDWCRHPAFRHHWPAIIEQYDQDFVAYMTKRYDEIMLLEFDPP